MGAIAAFLGDADDRVGLLGAMLDVARHRGADVAHVSVGQCVLGAVWNPGLPDTAVGTAFGLGVVITGSIDNQSELDERYSVRTPDEGASIAPQIVKLIATLYRTHGPDLPSHLRGVFAGVVTDGSTAFCFRDHLGHRPLFYRHAIDGFWVASEPKQVVAGAGLAREPDLAVLEAIFYRSLNDDSPAALRAFRRCTP